MKTINYKGAEIIKEGNDYNWSHPDYVDASFEGDHWEIEGCGRCSSVEECKEAINDLLRDD